MPRFIFGNFDFEHELAAPQHAPNSARLQLHAELSWHLTAFAAPDDFVLLPQQPTNEFLSEWSQLTGGCRIVSQPATAQSLSNNDTLAHAWGWSQRARTLALQAGSQVQAAALEIVRLANSRRCSVEIENRLGLTLPGSFVVTTMNQLAAELQRFNARQPAGQWVIKAEYGMSARERLLGRGIDLNASAHGWLEKRLRRGEWLVFEPWLDRAAEAGILLDVPPSSASDSTIRIIAVTELLTNEHGQYIGTRIDTGFAHDMKCHTPAHNPVTTALDVAEELQRLGYFGPLGIDAMQYRSVHTDTPVSTLIRPIQDINARWTMGFIATAMARRLAPQQVVTWRLLPTDRICHLLTLEPDSRVEQRALSCSGLDLTTALLCADHKVRALRTSPLSLEGTLTRQTGILLSGPTREAVAKAEVELCSRANGMG